MNFWTESCQSAINKQDAVHGKDATFLYAKPWFLIQKSVCQHMYKNTVPLQRSSSFIISVQSELLFAKKCFLDHNGEKKNKIKSGFLKMKGNL